MTNANDGTWFLEIVKMNIVETTGEIQIWTALVSSNISMLDFLGSDTYTTDM